MGVSYDLPSYVADCRLFNSFIINWRDPYCTKEALQVNTPCITTSYPATYEQIVDGENGYILDFDLFKNGTNKEWFKVIDKYIIEYLKFKYISKDKEIENNGLKNWENRLEN